jgi:hypothetical protein
MVALVHRLGDAVGVEDEGVAGLQQDRRRAAGAGRWRASLRDRRANPLRERGLDRIRSWPMGLVVFGIIFAVIGILIAIFGPRTDNTTVTDGSGGRFQFSASIVGGIILALIGAGLIVGGIVETVTKKDAVTKHK